MTVARTHSSLVETDPAHAASVALPPRVLSAFLDRVAVAASCPRAALDEVAAHAARTNMPIADALVSFGRVSEQVSYELLAAVSGMSMVSLAETAPALLAVRMVPACVARRHRLVPVMVLTSEEGPGVETTVLQLGADDYVLKPFDPGVLSSRVKAAFRRLRVAAA